MSTATPGAMRAAIEYLKWRGDSRKGAEDLAAFIDRETGAPELLACLKEYVTAFAEGAKMRYGLEVEKAEGRVTPALAFYRRACDAIAKAEKKGGAS